MKFTPQLYLRLAVAFCVVVGLYDVFVVASQFLGGNRFVKPQWVLYPDFLTPHSALRAWLEGKLSMVYTDIDKFTEYQNAVYADRFPYVVYFRPFLYPPLWLLLLLPLAWVAVDRAFAVFMAVTVGASAVEGRDRPWLWLATATSPAAVHVVLSGQGTFLNVALMYGGLRLLERAPVAAGVLFGLAGVMLVVMLISMLRRKKPATQATTLHLPARTILGAVARELNDVQASSRGGWSQDLAGRALAGARIAGAYAIGRTIGQRPAPAGESPVDGMLVIKAFGLGDVWVSGAATPQSAAQVAGLPEALAALTSARYGRTEKFDSMCDEALQTAIRVTKEQQSAHSLVKEWMAAFKANVVDLRRRIWA